METHHTQHWDDDNDTTDSESEQERDWEDNQDDEVIDDAASSSSEESDEDEYEVVDITVNSALVYSKTQLWNTTSSRERAYLRSRPGICAGLSLAWLQLIVRDDVEPANCWPRVSFARQLQEYIEDNSVRHIYFPEVAYMADEGRSVFDDVDHGLRYIWHNPGSYVLLIRAKYARIGHAVAYSDRYSYPNGYLMNPNKGTHCCYTYRGLSDQFRSDRFIMRAENSYHGPEFIVIRIGKPGGRAGAASSDGVTWHAREADADADAGGQPKYDDEDIEYVQYGV